ncbi:hypothetical protein [Paraglaciecola arctica]|uniref:hypothetical protein n=1 Tax=Paraglaciecola arctica TaxID=1128911 RepID=UPI001C075E12|nr:hypothetical protein [Paraglaciecola arctica]MBU3004642.1 hypothetical protein [Paraglaciecola arctica]
MEKRIGIRISCDAISEHHSVVDAIVNREPIAVEEAMAYHIAEVVVEIEIVKEHLCN